jgi:Fur family transcriptional regulator, stress-responsive regulator
MGAMGYDEQLREAGLRVTAPRIAVLAALQRLDGHPTADEIRQSARASVGAISPQAVYDILRVLAAAGIVGTIEPAGSAVRYELRTGDNHHHAICRECRATFDVDCVVGEPPCMHPSGIAGFTVEAAEVTFWGLCADCTARAAARE